MSKHLSRQQRVERENRKQMESDHRSMYGRTYHGKDLKDWYKRADEFEEA